MWMTKMLLKKSGQKMVKICNLYFQAEEVMTKRNEELKKENKIPYTVLLPSRIPAGISIWSLEKKELCFTGDLLNDAHLFCITLCFCPPGTLLAFQFYLSDGRLTDDGNIVITLKIARLRNALWRAILRRAILSMSFIRIARPIYFVFFVLICPSNSLMCCLE